MSSFRVGGPYLKDDIIFGRPWTSSQFTPTSRSSSPLGACTKNTKRTSPLELVSGVNICSYFLLKLILWMKYSGEKKIKGPSRNDVIFGLQNKPDPPLQLTFRHLLADHPLSLNHLLSSFGWPPLPQKDDVISGRPEIGVWTAHCNNSKVGNP